MYEMSFFCTGVREKDDMKVPLVRAYARVKMFMKSELIVKSAAAT